MKSFDVNGKSYDSMSDFCKKTGIKYGKIRRLCRKYLRAQQDPAVAAKWLLGLEPLNKVKEPKTLIYIKDKELSYARQIEFLARRRARCKRILAKIMAE